jgi:hypothetical protein
MSINRILMSAALALGLALGSISTNAAAEPHGHDGNASVQLKLDNGKKWQTDEALRRGMGEIRQSMSTSLKPIHRNTFTAANYEALASNVQKQVDFVVGNCKLSEDADAQLHLVLEQILDGIGKMKAPGEKQQGAEKIVSALDTYSKYFNHAGWKPLRIE